MASRLAVTLDACDRIALLRRMQDRRGGHYRFRLPEACLPQYCVYLASDAREREQERQRPGQEPRYRPTADDYLVRYLKYLVSWTMDRNACHVAVALGCFLYGYQPGDIADLAPEIFNHHNIRRVKRRLALQLHARFQSANIMVDEHHRLCTRAPTATNASWSTMRWRCLRLGERPTSPLRPPTGPCWKRTLMGFPPAQTGSASMP